MDEGYNKFECIWEQKSITIPLIPLTLLNKWRSHLKELDMIGQTAEGLSFGSLSFKNTNDLTFFINGNNTSEVDFLEPEDITWIEKADIENNTIWSTGKTKPGSEAFAHSVLYQANPQVKAVIQVHCADIWKKNLNKMPTTSAKAGYGTTAFAGEIESLLKSSDLTANPLIIVGGYKDKIFSFGPNLNVVGEALLKAYRQ
jgi:L-ribulose-5-phosphate 4-epimerase